MKNQLHAVLGASGIIGSTIIRQLQISNIPFRAVERTKNVPIPGVNTHLADISELSQLKEAVEGASHVYCCVGLKYDVKIWEQKWPVIIQNLITVCIEKDIKLVFFDNMYMYGPIPLRNPITEDHPGFPVSRKGKVRKNIQDTIMKAGQKAGLKYIIARSADFYGPGARMSLLYPSVLENMLHNIPPRILYNIDHLHTYTHVIDAASACVLLAMDEEAYGEVWHLPTNQNACSPRYLLELMQEEIGTHFVLRSTPKPIVKTVSLFVPIVKEISEMLYQYDHDYIFSSAKFITRYPDFVTTSYEQGAKDMARWFLDRTRSKVYA